MEKSPLLPKGQSKVILGLLTLTLTLIFIFVLNLPYSPLKQDPSFLELQPKENRFKVSFHISGRDQADFKYLLEKLQLPQDIQEGIEFELDATSSARLAFVSPIQTKFNLDYQRITFQGSLSRNPFPKSQEIKSIKIPESSFLAVSAADLRGFVKSRFNLPPQLLSWIDKQLNSSDQYLVIFGQNPEFALIAKSKLADFESLNKLKISTDQEEPPYVYKQDSQENVDFHLFKLLDYQNNQKTLTIFRLSDFIFMTSSFEAAQEIVKVQKSESPTVNFPNSNQKGVSLALLFQNNNQNPPKENFYDLLFAKSEPVAKTLKNLSYLELTLKEDRFSGLINIK